MNNNYCFINFGYLNSVASQHVYMIRVGIHITHTIIIYLHLCTSYTYHDDVTTTDFGVSRIYIHFPPPQPHQKEPQSPATFNLEMCALPCK